MEDRLKATRAKKKAVKAVLPVVKDHQEEEFDISRWDSEVGKIHSSMMYSTELKDELSSIRKKINKQS